MIYILIFALPGVLMALIGLSLSRRRPAVTKTKPDASAATPAEGNGKGTDDTRKGVPRIVWPIIGAIIIAAIAMQYNPEIQKWVEGVVEKTKTPAAPKYWHRPVYALAPNQWVTVQVYPGDSLTVELVKTGDGKSYAPVITDTLMNDLTTHFMWRSIQNGWAARYVGNDTLWGRIRMVRK